LSIACSGVIPLFMTSSMAMLKTCSASICAIAGFVAGPGRRCEQPHQLVELCFWPVLARETRAAFELRDEGVERAVLMVRRAEIAQAVMWLRSEVLGKCCREPRLADAWLAGDQHHPSFTALRLLPAAGQQLDFLLARRAASPPSARPRSGSASRSRPRPAMPVAARRSPQVPADRDPAD
jgi:hypothetical protein